MFKYIPRQTCSKEISFEIEDNKLKNVSFLNGCPGNLLGIRHLVEGMDVDHAIAKLSGIPCGNKTTSCPDQLAQALISWKNAHE